MHPTHTSSPLRRYPGTCLAVLVVAWGIQAIVTQSVLLREALVLMFGSELAWGVVLFAWLLGVAVGAAIGGWTAARLRRPDVGLVVVLLALSAAVCVDLWVFRGARSWLGVEPGELLPLPKTALAAVLFISPTSALVGMSFPLACCVNVGPAEGKLSDTRSPRIGTGGLLSLGNVYALESAGSLIGGAAFSFWAVEHLTPIETVLFCGAITAAASAGCLAAVRGARVAASVIAFAALAVLVAALVRGKHLNDRLVLRRWRDIAPGYALVAETDSKYQNLAVGKRAEQYTLYCDGHVTADFPDPYTFVPLAHLCLCQHPDPRRVLLLGGGAEGLLCEILRHPVEHVDYVETDARQIELIRPFLTDADRQALTDERVTVHHVDARYFVKTQRARFNLVIARLPEPTSALRARFYTDEFYGELRRAMTDRSVLCLTVAAAPGELSAVSAEYLASVRATLRRHLPYVTVGWGNPAHVLAATAPGLVSIDATELANRYTQRGVQSPYFDPLMFGGATDWLEPDKVHRRAAELDAVADAQVSTDLRPIVYLQRLVLWERMVGGPAGRVIERLRAIGWPELIGALLAIGVLTLLVCRVRGHPRGAALRADYSPWASGTIVLSIATTGFATMALSIIWLFAFQNLYGYVYQRIGWIIALFMGGLVIGCELAGRRAKRFTDSERFAPYLWQRLLAVDVLLALLSLSIPFLLPALGAMQSTRTALILVEWAVSVMVALTGVLGGAAFALAGGLQLEIHGRPAAAAGSIVGADHAGACLGALLTGILLVPVFGTAAAAFLLVGVKLSSALLLLAGWRLSRAA